MKRSTNLLTALLLAPLAAAEFYIVPNGNYTNSGTKEQPFATLERAWDVSTHE